MAKALTALLILFATGVALALGAVAVSYLFDGCVIALRAVTRRPRREEPYVPFWMPHDPAPYKGTHRPRRGR